MGRSPCCSKEGLNRGAWTALEDKILTDYITLHGEGRWRNLPKRAGLKRCGKSCRLRWLNYLRPDIKRGNITPDEEELIIRLHKLLGNRWSLIAGRLPGRTDNEIKNYWNTNLGKRVKDPRHHHASSSSRTTTLASAAHDVVHTKATKCSKVIISNPILMYNNNHNSEAMNNGKEASPNNNINDDEDAFETGTDLLMGEFNMGDLCLSDLLNSDFSTQMCHFTTTTYSNSDDILSPSCSDHPFHFSDDDILNLNDWTHTTHNNNATTQTPPPHHHHNIHHLHSFNSYLHSPQQCHLPH